MGALRTIRCDSFWDALVLRLKLEEQGVRVRRPDEGVVPNLVVSGALGAIKDAVAQFSDECPGSGPVVIEGDSERPIKRQCEAHKPDGSRCRLSAVRGSNVCHKHGAAAGQVRRAAARRVAEAEGAVAFGGEDRAEDADTVQFAATEPLPDIPTSNASGITEEVKARPGIDVQPEPATAAPAGHTLIPARPPAEQRPGRQTRQDEEAASPEKATAPRGNVQASPEKAQARPPKAAWPKALGGRHRRITSGVILVVALLFVGSLAFLLARHVATAPTTDGYGTGASAEVALRNRAAAWVAGQVSRNATVSCDRVMCQAVEAHGFPAASVLELRPGKADPIRSKVIVVTATVRRMVGNRLTADAPEAIASFGSGSMWIDIRVIAPRGAAAYFSALRADIRDRKSAAPWLLQTRRITMSATARRQLADGQIDSRLMVTIASLAEDRPVSIVAFGDLPPGASPGIPLRSADLAPPAGMAGPKRAAEMQRMSDLLHAQQSQYLTARITVVPLAGGRNVLHVEFAAPSPLGLLNPRTQ